MLLQGSRRPQRTYESLLLAAMQVGDTVLAAAVHRRLEADPGLGARRLYQVVVIRRRSARGRGCE
jgi:hypothetical protein